MVSLAGGGDSVAYPEGIARVNWNSGHSPVAGT